MDHVLSFVCRLFKIVRNRREPERERERERERKSNEEIRCDKMLDNETSERVAFFSF